MRPLIKLKMNSNQATENLHFFNSSTLAQPSTTSQVTSEIGKMFKQDLRMLELKPGRPLDNMQAKIKRLKELKLKEA
jgi:hypothetical protein